MTNNSVLTRVLGQKSKLLKAVFLGFAKSIPVIGGLVDAYHELEQELRTEEVDKQVSRLAQNLCVDENLLDAITVAHEQELADSLAQTVQAVPEPVKLGLVEVASRFAQTHDPQVRGRLFSEATRVALVALAEAAIHTRPSVAQSLHGLQTQEKMLAAGQVLADRFEVLELIAWGGMGTVYKVHDRKLDEVRAVKTIAPSLLQDEALYRKWLGEVKLAMRLSHPNIVRVYDIAESEKTSFLIMEWIDGKSLRHTLTEKGCLPWSEASSLLRDISRGLALAHSQNILHLDLKPENIMLTAAGTAKIIDFGLAKALDKTQLAKISQSSGTFGYMAPEQFAGNTVTKATDIYSLAVVIYEAVCGTLPMGRFAPPHRYCSEIPVVVSQALMHALDHEPGHRPQTIEEFLGLSQESRLHWSQTAWILCLCLLGGMIAGEIMGRERGALAGAIIGLGLTSLILAGVFGKHR